PAEHLPFPDNTFDVVTCLEALEFMERPEATLAECVRVLRPDGVLLVTNRINTRLMPGKTMTNQEIAELLQSLGMDDVEVEYWQVDYNRVWGIKGGMSQPTGARPLAEILVCPRCSTRLDKADDAYVCPTGHFRAPIGADGVIEMAHQAT